MIRRRVLAGEPYRMISRDVGISHAAIRQMAKRRGWKHGTPRLETLKPETRALETSRVFAEPRSNGERKQIVFGKRTPENAERIIELMQNGASQSAAARAVGIGHSTLSAWMNDDPGFRDRCVASNAEVTTELEGTIVQAGRRGDWRASKEWLSRNPHSREHWSDQAGGMALSVTFNFGRDMPGARGTGQIIEGQLVSQSVSEDGD